MRDVERVNWHADLLNVVDEPMILSLLRYDMAADRQIDPDGELVSSYLLGSDLHAPIIDLDFPFTVISGSDGRRYLAITVPQQLDPNSCIRLRTKVGVLLVHELWRRLFGARVSESSPS